MGRTTATLAGCASSGIKPTARQALSLGLAVVASLVGIRGTQDAAANGDTRTITIRHMHTKEETTVTFKRDGRYDALVDHYYPGIRRYFPAFFAGYE